MIDEVQRCLDRMDSSWMAVVESSNRSLLVVDTTNELSNHLSGRENLANLGAGMLVMLYPEAAHLTLGVLEESIRAMRRSGVSVIRITDMSQCTKNVRLRFLTS